MNENTAKLIEQLAQKLGTTSEYLWGVLLKQASISATVTLLKTIAILLFGWFLWKTHKRLLKKESEDRYAVCRWCRKPYGKGTMINYLPEHFEQPTPPDTPVKEKIDVWGLGHTTWNNVGESSFLFKTSPIPYNDFPTEKVEAAISAALNEDTVVSVETKGFERIRIHFDKVYGSSYDYLVKDLEQLLFKDMHPEKTDTVVGVWREIGMDYYTQDGKKLCEWTAYERLFEQNQELMNMLIKMKTESEVDTMMEDTWTQARMLLIEKPITGFMGTGLKYHSLQDYKNSLQPAPNKEQDKPVLKVRDIKPDGTVQGEYNLMSGEKIDKPVLFTTEQYKEIWDMIFSQTGFPPNHPETERNQKQ